MGAIEEITGPLPVVGSMYRNLKRAALIAVGVVPTWIGYYSWNNFLPAETKKTICNAIGFTSMEQDFEYELRKKFNLVEEKEKKKDNANKKVGTTIDAAQNYLNDLIASNE